MNYIWVPLVLYVDILYNELIWLGNFHDDLTKYLVDCNQK